MKQGVKKQGVKYILTAFISVLAAMQLSAQTVDVDVNWNIEHSVGGVSDFGRERHITLHSNFLETDWDGEEDKLDYLMNDLDVYFGRDNGSATWKFQATTQDPDRPNMADISAMTNLGTWLRSEYEKEYDRLQYEPRQQEMIMGTNPHPTYPTLSWYDNGFTWDGWQPKNIETSAEWMVNYLDLFFERDGDPVGEKMPMYWEIINEPDMPLMTGQFMVTGWEALFEYHNLVAIGVKERLGDEAPLIGGMTWGQHDIHVADGISRYTSNYLDQYLEEPALTFYNEAGYTKWPGAGTNWDQWDKIWQGFVDACGENMDFYSVHIYDWPQRGMGSSTSRMRTGGHTEGLLDIMEWYDVYKHDGVRKPIVLSEYGSVAGYIDQSKDGLYIDWECVRPFSSMMMQFLERPDYLVKTMPFTPIKAEWGNYYNADGSLLARYPYTMLDENPDGSDNWEWSGYILWFELWADVEGTRVETKASDMDIQVDAYVNGDHAFLILNNLENTTATINLHEFGLGTGVDSVRIKHLYCENHADYASTTGYGVLDDYTLQTAPGSVTLDPEATMIIRYNFTSSFAPAATLVESKVYGEKLGTGTNPRGGEQIRHTGATFTGYINGVTVPAGAAEATLRISGSFTTGSITTPRDGLDYIRINGNDLPFYSDWRGQEIGNGGYGWLGTLEVPVPVEYLQANNTITASFNNSANQYAALSLQIFDYSTAPGRYGETADVPVTGMSISEASISLNQEQEGSVTAVVSPSSATDKSISWTSGNTSVAVVDPNTGLITGVGSGSATITATTTDGGYSDTVTVNVSSSSAVAVEGVRVNPANRTLLLDETATSVATVLPADADNQSVTWSSSAPGVATVSSAGLITAVGEGTATITAATADGGYTDATVVTVPAPVAVTGVTIAPESALLPTGNAVSLVATVWPTDAYDQSVTWASLDPSVATVTSAGVVTGVAEGVVEIQATTTDGGFVGSCAVTVFTPGTAGASVTLEAEDADVLDGLTIYDIPSGGQGVNHLEAGEVIEFTSAAIPENGIYQIQYVIATELDGTTASFSLDGTTVAADAVPNTGGWDTYTTLTSSGYFAAAAGSHTIRLFGSAAWNWNLDAVILTKIAEGGDPIDVESVSIDQSSTSIAAGTTVQLSATVLPINASNKSVTWTSLNSSAASVSTTGLVSGLAEGSAQIRVTSADGGFTDTITVTVTPGASVDGVSVSPVTTSVAAGYTVQLTETVTPSDALDKSVTWSSLNPSIATVDSDGLVSGVAEGTASIVVTTTDGSYTATNETTVTLVHATSVSLPTSSSVAEGGTTQLTATVLPADAVDKSVTWESLNTSIATVNGSGLVSGIARGTTEIVVTTVDGGLKATNTMTVTSGSVDSVSVSPTTGTIAPATTIQLTATALPVDAPDTSVSWSSLNPTIATVDSNGLVSGVAVGTASIVATTTDGGLTATATITVSDGTGGASLTVEAESFTDKSTEIQTYTVGDVTAINYVQTSNYAEYEVTIPETGIYKIDYLSGTALDSRTVTFSVGGVDQVTDTVPNNGDWDAFASFQSGEVVSLTSGAATIRLTAGADAWNWNLDKFVLTRIDGGVAVPVDVTGVTVSPTTSSIDEGATTQLTATVIPGNASDQSVTWESLNPSVATVDSNGLVSGVDAGTASIVVTTVDGGFKATNVTTVTEIAVTGVSIAPATSGIQVGGTAQLTATVAPANAANQSVTWSSLSPAVATVDSSGLVSGVAEGTASIVVTTVDGGFAATNVTTVTVDEPPVDGPVMDISIVDGQVVISATNGTSDAYFSLLSNTNLLEGAGWQVIASNLTFDAAGDAIVSNSTSADQVYFKIEEGESTVISPAPTELTIEAEAFDSTGGSGTYVNYSAYGGDDAVGVMSYTTGGGVGGINFVQLDDYAEYLDIEVAPGVYEVEYFTGTTVADSQISLQIDGSTVASDNVVNNNDWDTFVSLVSSTQVEITAGTHTLRVVGTGATEWQWNLDRIELIKVGDLP